MEGRDEEERKLQLMKDSIFGENPSGKYADDVTLLRFLRARELDVEKASAMFLKYVKWKETIMPNGSISATDIPHEIAQDKLFMQGVDKMYRPIVVVLAARHRPSKGHIEEFKRFVAFSLERISSRVSSRDGNFCAIADIAGWGYSCSDVRGYLAALSILQDCYPERLGKLFMIHVPYLFMAAWKLVYPLVDPKTKKKIVFVEDKHLRSTLLAHIDEHQLPEIYGGKQAMVPIHEA